MQWSSAFQNTLFIGVFDRQMPVSKSVMAPPQRDPSAIESNQAQPESGSALHEPRPGPPEALDPFSEELLERLLGGLALPLHRRAGFTTFDAKLPAIKLQSQVRSQIQRQHVPLFAARYSGNTCHCLEPGTAATRTTLRSQVQRQHVPLFGARYSNMCHCSVPGITATCVTVRSQVQLQHMPLFGARYSGNTCHCCKLLYNLVVDRLCYCKIAVR